MISSSQRPLPTQNTEHPYRQRDSNQQPQPADLRLTPHGHRDLPQRRTVHSVYFTEHFKTIGYSFGPSLLFSFSTLLVSRIKYRRCLINDKLKGYGGDRALNEVLFRHLQGATEETKESQKSCCTGWDSNQAPPKASANSNTSTPAYYQLLYWLRFKPGTSKSKCKQQHLYTSLLPTTVTKTITVIHIGYS